MSYDTVIVELLAKVNILENRVKRIEKRLIQEELFDADEILGDDWDIEISEPAREPETKKKEKKITTEAIRFHVSRMIEVAREEGKPSVTIVARDVHNSLNLKRSYPMVCNAMRQCMKRGDVVVHATESGYSSTLEIKYYT